jgi:hypothetical protein
VTKTSVGKAGFSSPVDVRLLWTKKMPRRTWAQPSVRVRLVPVIPEMPVENRCIRDLRSSLGA